MKKLSLFIMCILLIFSISACSQSVEPEPEDEPQPISNVEVKVAGLKGPTSIGMIKMIDEQQSIGENTQVSYDILPTPDVLVSKLLNGEYDFATIPTNVASIIYNKKGEYQLAGVPIWGVLYVVTNGVEITDWDDFKGQTVYPFAQASTPDVIFKYLLEKNGVSLDDVTLDYSVQQAELGQALVASEVSVAVLPEPFVTAVTMKNADIKIQMDIQEEWKKIQTASSAVPSDASYPMTAIVVKKEFAEAHPEMVEAFLNQYDDSIKWVNESTADAAMLVEKHEIGLKAKAAEQAIPRCNLELVHAPTAKTTIENYLSVLNEFSPKTIGGQMPDENFYYGE